MTGIERLFSTPVMVERAAESATDWRALRETILRERARRPEGLVQSNRGGWHSEITLQHWGGEPALALGRLVCALADRMTVDPNRPEVTNHRWKVDMWANVGGAGDFHMLHHHPGCVWSAVVYIDDGYEGSPDPSLGGELRLLDPRMPMMRMAAPHLWLRGEDGHAQPIAPAIRPSERTIIVFPAWLGHQVEPFQGTGTRISVAVNLAAG